MRRAERWAFTGLAAIALVTAGWWVLALWPLPETTPAWLLRTRAVCFNTTPNGLPDVSGWLLLIGQPLGMLGFLVVAWGAPLRAAFRTLWHGVAGQLVLGSLAMVLVLGLAAAGWRVASADAGGETRIAAEGIAFTALDRVAPPLSLVTQTGERRRLPPGMPALVTFAYAHCETVCPLILHETRAARAALADRVDVPLFIVTLDPWRDVPERLPFIAGQWGLEAGEYVLSGSVAEVEAALDAWGVARRRDAQTGDIIHPNVTYVVGTDGRLAYAAQAGRATIVSLVEQTAAAYAAR